MAMLPSMIFILGLLFIIFHLDLKPVVGDEGVLAMDAWRITQGQVPQRDFFEIIPPIAAYIQAALFYLVGPSVLSIRLLGALYGVLLMALAWIAARRYLKEPLFVSLVLALLIPFGTGVWPFGSHHWLADIFLLAALPVLDRAFNANFTTEAQRHGEGILGFAGWPWRGLTAKAQRARREEKGEKEADIRQATGQDSFLGAGHGEKINFTTEGAGAKGHGEEKKVPPRLTLNALPLTLCISSVPPRLSGGLLAALGGALLTAAALTLQDQGGYAFIGAIVAVLATPKEKRFAIAAGILSGAFVLSAIVITPLAIKAGPSSLVRDWLLFPMAHYHNVSANRITLAQGLVQIASQWDSAAFRVAPVYAATIALASTFVYLLPFLCLFALCLAWKFKWLPRSSTALLAAFSAAFVLAAWHRWSLMNLIWAAPVPMIAASMGLERISASPRRMPAVLAKGFAVALLSCLAVFSVLRIKAASEKDRLHDIVTPAGGYQTFSPIEASEIQGLVNAISDNVPHGAQLFCYGFNPLVNFITQHPNPTRYNFVLPGGYTSAEQMAQWQAALLSKNVKWGYGPNLPSEPPEPLQLFLRAHYDPVWNNSAYTLWKRKAAEQ